MTTRRDFLHAASTVAALALVPSWITRAGGTPLLYVPSMYRGDPDLYELAARAVDAARSAGASYADARLTLRRDQSPGINESEARAFGVRALVNGYWGFRASAVWTADEAANLAKGAVTEAIAYSRGKVREVALGPAATVRRGEWVMPVKYDPFDIPVGEKLDVMSAFTDAARNYKSGVGSNGQMRFAREHKVFASSDDVSIAQTIYLSTASFGVSCRDEYHAGLPFGGAGADFLSMAGRGWEYVSESGIVDAIPRLVDEAEQSRHQVPVDVGRYDLVLTADAMAGLLDETIGAATELDRALGYEANASGTSYFDDPLAMLGSQPAGSPLVNVVGNRSLPGGVATVQWDDEGIVPEDFTIVKDGMLVDYQTTREQAAWLAPYYQRTGKPVRSHGCANASSALSITMQHSPNIALMPGRSSITFEDLVAGTEKGIAVLSLGVSMDQQKLNGMGSGAMREIVKGKLGRFIRGGALIFRAPELWKNLVAIGGPQSLRWYGMGRSKGQPAQGTSHSVGAVPGKIKQQAIIDATRKA